MAQACGEQLIPKSIGFGENHQAYGSLLNQGAHVITVLRRTFDEGAMVPIERSSIGSTPASRHRG